MHIKTPIELIKDNLIVKHLAGSYSYGTNTDTSDIDYRGIFVADPVYIRTPFFNITETKDTSEEDTVIYELNQFMRLVIDCNPTVLESLFVDKTHIVYTTPAYELLRSYAHKLLCSKIAFTTSGYAKSQLNRLSRHTRQATRLPILTKLCKLLQVAYDDKLIDNVFIVRECGNLVFDFMMTNGYLTDQGDPIISTLDQLYVRYNVLHTDRDQIKIICKPQQKNFTSLIQWFDANTLLSSEFTIDDYNIGHILIPYGTCTYGIYKSPSCTIYDGVGNLIDADDYNMIEVAGALPLVLIRFNKSEYDQINDGYVKFWEWRSNRNPTRLAMEESFNYDGKHAMHLVRLLRIGEEVLTTGDYNVTRHDARELLDIRDGKWTYDELVEYAEEKDNHIRTVLYHSTHLPKTPDYKLAAKLIIDVQDLVWSTNNGK
jgi:DNA-binding Xre family transcriptional regulator